MGDDYFILKEKIIFNYTKLAKTAEFFLSGIEPNRKSIKRYHEIHSTVCEILLELYDIDNIESKEICEYMIYCKRYSELVDLFRDTISKVYDN